MEYVRPQGVFTFGFVVHRVYDKDILAKCLAVNYLSVVPLLALPDILRRRPMLFRRHSLLGVSVTL